MKQFCSVAGNFMLQAAAFHGIVPCVASTSSVVPMASF